MHTFRQIEQRIKKLYIDRVFAEIIVLKLLLYWYLILHSFPREGRVGWWKSSLLYFKWYQNIKLLTFSCWPFQPRSIIWEECKLFYFSPSFSLYFIFLFNYTSVGIKTSRRFSTWNIFKSITKYFQIQNKQNIVKYQAVRIKVHYNCDTILLAARSVSPIVTESDKDGPISWIRIHTTRCQCCRERLD